MEGSLEENTHTLEFLEGGIECRVIGSLNAIPDNYPAEAKGENTIMGLKWTGWNEVPGGGKTNAPPAGGFNSAQLVVLVVPGLLVATRRFLG